MRMISFALTTQQIDDLSKTVTRRIGWKDLKPGTLLQPVVKAQGLKKGERVTRIGSPIRVVSVRREPLGLVLGEGPEELLREGFPNLTGVAFVNLFCDANGCEPDDVVTRIEFEYVERLICPTCHHRMDGVAGMCTVTEGSCRCSCIEELAKVSGPSRDSSSKGGFEKGQPGSAGVLPAGVTVPD